jgi:hypothetical protein
MNKDLPSNQVYYYIQYWNTFRECWEIWGVCESNDGRLYTLEQCRKIINDINGVKTRIIKETITYSYIE